MKQEQEKLVGTGSKIAAGIAAAAAVMLFGCYMVLSFLSPPAEEKISLPPGGLTESIFDSQNMNYTAIEGLNTKAEFQKIPFTIDVIDGKKAAVGNAQVYYTEPYYFYFTELGREDNLTSAIMEEYTPVIDVDADSTQTVVDYLYEEEGYINGCEAVYKIVQVTAEGGDVHCGILYRLHITDEIYESGTDIVIACLSDAVSSDILANAQQLAYASIFTLQYSKALDKE